MIQYQYSPVGFVRSFLPKPVSLKPLPVRPGGWLVVQTRRRSPTDVLWLQPCIGPCVDEEDNWLLQISYESNSPTPVFEMKTPTFETTKPKDKGQDSCDESLLQTPIKSKGGSKAFVELSTPTPEPMRATAFAFKNLEGDPLTDEDNFDLDASDKVASFEPNNETKREVFVSSIRFGTTAEEIRKLFSVCGDVTSVKLPLDGSRRKIRGIGFVSFAKESSVTLAIATLNGYEVGGRRIQVRRNRGKVPLRRKQALQRQRIEKQKFSESPPSDSLTVFVGNLPFEMSADCLKSLIQECRAQVADCRIVCDAVGKSRGFAYVDLADGESVLAAIEFLNDKLVDGRVLRADYSMPFDPDFEAKKQAKSSPKFSNKTVPIIPRLQKYHL